MTDLVRPDMIPLLDEAAVRLFRRAVRQGQLDCSTAGVGVEPDPAFDESCAALVRLGLLRPVLGRPGAFVPTSPEVAAATAIAPLQAGIARTGAQIEAIRDELASLMPQYLEARRHAQTEQPSLPLPDPTTLAAVLAQEAARCQEEVLFVLPADGGPLGSDQEALVRDLAMLRRGIRVRILCRPAEGARAQDRARLLAAAGAEQRTALELPGWSAVFDRSVAVVPDPDDEADGALLLRGRQLVAYLCQVLDRLWSSAAPRHTAAATTTDDLLSSQLRRALVRLLAEGVKDEIIARRLGVSLRTCRRHVAEILDGLGADSRFQGGVLAERAGLLTVAQAP